MKEIVIVGAGISGLNLGIKLLKKYKNVVIYEKNNYVGGRISTQQQKINNKIIRYESGAARFNKNQKQILKLIKKYKLTSKIIKIHNEWNTILTNYNYAEPVDVNIILFKFCNKIKKMPKKKLVSVSFFNLLKETYGKPLAEYIKDAYPYYSELFVLSAYDGLRMFLNDLSNDNQFYILKGGLTQLINKMKKNFTDKGGRILLNHTLTDLKLTLNSHLQSEKNKFQLKFLDSDFNSINLECTDVVLACDGFSLQKMRFLDKFNFKNMLKSVDCQPLLRTYAIYKDCWFKGLPKIVTNEFIKYIIPIDYKNNVIMISYTDGFYAKYWKEIIDSDVSQKEKINEILKKIFPILKIKDPINIFNYYWEQGACYWKPGNDSDILKEKIMKPTKHNLFICGDSFSSHQAWMEGALETSNKLFSKYF